MGQRGALGLDPPLELGSLGEIEPIQEGTGVALDRPGAISPAQVGQESGPVAGQPLGVEMDLVRAGEEVVVAETLPEGVQRLGQRASRLVRI